MSWTGVLIYLVKAADFHLPSVLMKESLKPAFAAVEAAPIRKLWPEKFVASSPILCRASLRFETRVALLRGVPFWKMNKGPGVGGRSAR